jgi:hypothetical protein
MGRRMRIWWVVALAVGLLVPVLHAQSPTICSNDSDYNVIFKVLYPETNVKAPNCNFNLWRCYQGAMSRSLLKFGSGDSGLGSMPRRPRCPVAAGADGG